MTLPTVAARLEAVARCRRDGGSLVTVTATNNRTGVRFSESLPPYDAAVLLRDLQRNPGFSNIGAEGK